MEVVFIILAVGAVATFLVMLMINKIRERNYLKARSAPTGGVASGKSNFIRHVTDDSYTVTILMAHHQYDTVKNIILQFTPETLFVSPVIKSSMWAYKRHPQMQKMVEGDAWKAKAGQYDMALISAESFRLTTHDYRDHQKSAQMYYVVMDYGERTITLTADGWYGKWVQEYATQDLLELRRAFEHVQAARHGVSISVEEVPPQSKPPKSKPQHSTPPKPAVDDPF